MWKHIGTAQLGHSTECSLDGVWAQLTVQVLWDTVPLHCWAQCLPAGIAVGQASKSICPSPSKLHFGLHCLLARQNTPCDITEPTCAIMCDSSPRCHTANTCKHLETAQPLIPAHPSLNADRHGRPRWLTCQGVVLAKDQNEDHPSGLPDHGAPQAVSVIHCCHVCGRRMDQQPRPLQSQGLGQIQDEHHSRGSTGTACCHQDHDCCKDQHHLAG